MSFEGPALALPPRQKPEGRKRRPGQGGTQGRSLAGPGAHRRGGAHGELAHAAVDVRPARAVDRGRRRLVADERRVGVDRQRLCPDGRSEEHTSELQSLMRISYAVFCLKKKKQKKKTKDTKQQ